MSDPLVRVRVLDMKQHTSAKSSTVNCTWDELLFFDMSVGGDQFMSGKIAVEVMDSNTVMRDTLIGAYEFGFADVYSQEGHELYKQWVALIDTSLKESGIQVASGGVAGSPYRDRAISS